MNDSIMDDSRIAHPDSVLCYVLPRTGMAYFTSQPLDKQWGDDWDDAPYQHNAGTPYGPCWHREGGQDCSCALCEEDWHPDGRPRFVITSVLWEGPFESPAQLGRQDLSVEDINRRPVPWLSPMPGTNNEPLFAGTRLGDFIGRLTAAGGEVYTVLDRDCEVFLSDESGLLRLADHIFEDDYPDADLFVASAKAFGWSEPRIFDEILGRLDDRGMESFLRFTDRLNAGALSRDQLVELLASPFPDIRKFAWSAVGDMPEDEPVVEDRGHSRGL